MKISLLRGVMVGALALLGVGALSSDASAYTVDFDTNWGGSTINNQSTASWANADGSGVTVTLTAAPTTANLTLDPSDGGVGVDYSYEDDEIEGPEMLKISFSSPVALGSVYLVDLFVEPYNSYFSGTYAEKGSYQIGDGDLVPFGAEPSQTSGTEGAKTLQIDQLVTTIAFSAPGISPWGSKDSEFAVAGLSFSTPSSSVPELDARSGLGAIGLLFVGLMVGTSRRRRFHIRPVV